jgi:hypothetical protein
MGIVLAFAFTIIACGGNVPVIKVAPVPATTLALHVPQIAIPIPRPVDIHDGMVFESAGVDYWIGTSYGCGFDLGSPTSKYCGVVGYHAASAVGPWYDETMLFDPAAWQARCGAPNYGCFRPHVVWDPNTGDWRLWINVAERFKFGYAVFASPSPLGPYAYVGDATLNVGTQYGDESLFVVGSVGYVAYTVIGMGRGNVHNIVVERLDPTFQVGVGGAVMLNIPQWVESPTMFERNGSYYVAYSDPSCAFCSSSGTSYAVGSSPLGPWSEVRHSITKTSCNGQVASVNLVNGQYLYQSDLWTGSMVETTARQWWESLSFDGSTILPIKCTGGIV